MQPNNVQQNNSQGESNNTQTIAEEKDNTTNQNNSTMDTGIEPIEPIKLNDLEENVETNNNDIIEETNSNVDISTNLETEQNSTPINEEESAEETVTTTEQLDNNEFEENVEQVEPVKRRRGRPRKIKPVDISGVPEVKRKRGRPRKITENEQTAEIVDDSINSIQENNAGEQTSTDDLVNVNNTEDILPIVNDENTNKPVVQETNHPMQMMDNIDLKQNTANTTATSNINQNYRNMNTNNSVNSNYSKNNEIQPINLYDLDINSNDDIYSNSNVDLGVQPLDSIGNEQQASAQDDTELYNEFENTAGYSDSLENSNQLVNTEDNIVDLNLNAPLAGNGKVVSFVGTSKNGTSFIVNNRAFLLAQSGINTAVVDLTQNKNSYYMFTDNDPNKTKIASESLKKLANGVVEGLNVKNNLTIFTALPEDRDNSNSNVNQRRVLESLSSRFEVVLLDCDFKTDAPYFVFSNEIYLIQSMDAFTIQPLTKFLSDLKLKKMLDEEKLRIVVNKYVKLKKLDAKMIVGGMSKYNEPSMTLQRDLFDPRKITTTTIPFDMETYTKYLESIALCSMTLNGYSKEVIDGLEKLKNLVYPLVAGGNRNNRNNGYNNNNSYDNNNGFNNNNSFNNNNTNNYNNDMGYNNQRNSQGFSNNMNDTLNKMRTNNF